MPHGYLHVDFKLAQVPKKSGHPCGDVVLCDRDAAGTTILFADGVGSGIKAHITASLWLSRFRELLQRGFSLHSAFNSLVRTMETARAPNRAFAAITAARVRPDGMTSVLSYEMPPPLIISKKHAGLLHLRSIQSGGAVAGEGYCYLQPDEGLLLVSDGITQAGLGNGLPMGWEPEGLLRFVNGSLGTGMPLKELPGVILKEALTLWKKCGDDCSVALAQCERGRVVNILSGPPASPSQDAILVRQFLNRPGLKVVCGGATAEMVARELGQKLELERFSTSLIAPPRFKIEGVDLVCEGAVTLNQAYNLLGEDPDSLEEDSGVSDLCRLLQTSDRVNIMLGTARNKAHGDVSFRQQGVLSRERIVPLLAEKLREAGKLVVLEQC